MLALGSTEEQDAFLRKLRTNVEQEGEAALAGLSAENQATLRPLCQKVIDLADAAISEDDGTDRGKAKQRPH